MSAFLKIPSAYPPEADENDAKAEVAVGMSAVGGKADVPGTVPKSPLIATSGHSSTFSAAWILSIMTATL